MPIGPTERMLAHFTFDHLPKHLQEVSGPCGSLAQDMANHLPASAELTVGLRKLLEAKDCFVRAAVEARRENPPPVPKP